MIEAIKKFLLRLQYEAVVADLLYEGKKEKDLMSWEEWYKLKTGKNG